MRRHEELTFAILAWRENVEVPGEIPPPDLPDWTRDQVCYHAELCREEGWLRSYRHTVSGDGPIPRILECRIGPLTAAGHNTLRQLRKARR